MSRRNSQPRNGKGKSSPGTERVAASNLDSKTRRSRLQLRLNEFTQSLSDVLVDITAIEVNTMVVEHISGEKFIPWESYREIYPLDRAYLEQSNIHPSLRDRYLELRKNLEIDYLLAIANPGSELYDPSKANGPEANRILSDPTGEITQQNTQLPNPFKSHTTEELSAIQSLLSNSRFLRSLRKIAELKTTLDNRNQTLLKMDAAYPGNAPAIIAKAVKTDLIYAQTVIQLDGDIINRYNDVILDHPHKDVILKIHHDSVAASERQWRGILGFVVDLVQKALDRGGNVNLPAARRR